MLLGRALQPKEHTNLEMQLPPVFILIAFLLQLTLTQGVHTKTFSGPARNTRSKTRPKPVRPNLEDIDERAKAFLSDPSRGAKFPNLHVPLQDRQNDVRLANTALQAVGINAGKEYLEYREKHLDALKQGVALIFNNRDRWRPLMTEGLFNDAERLKEIGPLLRVLYKTADYKDAAKSNRLTNEVLAKIVKGVKAVRYQWNAKQRAGKRAGKRAGGGTGKRA